MSRQLGYDYHANTLKAKKLDLVPGNMHIVHRKRHANLALQFYEHNSSKLASLVKICKVIPRGSALNYKGRHNQGAKRIAL